MEFLTEYGLFIAKTVTLLIAFAVVVAIVGAAAMKSKKDDEQIEVEKINERYDEYRDLMKSAVLSADDVKKEKKTERKKIKEEKKAAKKKKEPKDSKPRVFVTEFDGDVKASDAEQLRTIVTAILTVANPNDEVVVKLESSGGMVHSYGLASSQLTRITDKNIPLTICVDMVAASGGYMMACVANKILAAPFAIIGSIGVIAQLPNFHKLLKKAEIDYEMHTAGEYKRTLTMFGENTDKGREKFQEELEDTHVLFKEFVGEHREVLDVADVATGEIWFGKRALEKKLIDEIKTSDEYLLEKSEACDIYELSIVQKKSVMERLGVEVAAGVERGVSKVLQTLSLKYY